MFPVALDRIEPVLLQTSGRCYHDSSLELRAAQCLGAQINSHLSAPSALVANTIKEHMKANEPWRKDVTS